MTTNNLIIKISIIIGINIFSNSLFSQPMWALGGNTDAGPPANQGLLTQSNFFGGLGTASLRLGTANTSRLFIGGTTIGNPGYIGIGRNFLNPTSVLHINSVGYTTGEVFRTSSPGGSATFWRLESGGNPKFNISVPANSNNAFLSTVSSGVGSGGSLFFQTANGGTTSQNRMKLNSLYGPGGQTQYALNGYTGPADNVNTTGYALLGNNNFGNDMTPWSLLHLNGSGAADFGYRPWMQTGITFTDNADMAYIGFRAIPNPDNLANNGRDRNEMVIAWSNDPGTVSPGAPFIPTQDPFGPDDMVFRFMGGLIPDRSNANIISPDNTQTNDLDGRHIARFTPQGNFGIGPNFGFQSLTSPFVYMAPTHRIDVEGNGRFRNIPNDTRTDFLLLGQYPDVNNDNVLDNTTADDLELSKLAFADDATLFLNSSGQWASVPAGPPGPVSPMLAENGASVNAFGRVVLGQNFNQGVADPAKLLEDRYLPMNNFNIHFINDGKYKQNKNCIGIGTNGTTITPAGKLHLNLDAVDSTKTALHIVNSSSSTGNIDGFGIFNQVSGANGRFNYGEKSIVKSALVRNINKSLESLGGTITEGIVVTAKEGSTSNFGVTVTVGRDSLELDNVTKKYTTSNNYAFSGEAYGAGANKSNFGATFTAGKSSGNNPMASNSGVVANARGSGSQNFGIDAYATGGTNLTIAVDASVNSADGSGINFYGVRTTAEGATTVNAGIFAETGTTAINNYAIYAKALPSLTVARFAGYFEGNVHVLGNIDYTGTLTDVSDVKFKQGIDTITNALGLINSLNPKTFYFDTVQYNDFAFTSQKQYGFVAQEVEAVLPDLVYNRFRPAQFDSLGNETSPRNDYKTIDYNGFIAVLTEAVQQQQTQLTTKDSLINDLNARLTQLENCLSSLLPTLCQMNQQAIQQNDPATQDKITVSADRKKAAIEINLTDKGIILLSQNVPNPFAESTVISYNIPANVKQAQIHFYTNLGILLQSVDLTERGLGELRVFASDLSSGTYSYSLVADGVVVVSKKMVRN